jgi:hypothetical protein
MAMRRFRVTRRMVAVGDAVEYRFRPTETLREPDGTGGIRRSGAGRRRRERAADAL